MFKYCLSLALLLAAGTASAACEFEVEVGDSLAYNTNAIAADASCAEVTIKLVHTGTLPAVAMGHNWVLAKTDDYEAVATDGMTAGFEGNFLPADDARVIAATKLVGGGESTSISFSTEGLSADGSYTFFCSFPGHTALMNGTFSLN
ncbi:MAG: azurin [Pseudomonadota bacterium]